MLCFLSFTPFEDGFPVLERSERELCIPNVPRLLHAPESSVGDQFAIFDTKPIFGFDFATTRSSPQVFPSCCLFEVILDLFIDLDMAAHDNSSLELFWFAHFVHELLDFLDELQCSESWEYATRNRSVLRQLCPKFCIVMNL